MNNDDIKPLAIQAVKDKCFLFGQLTVKNSKGGAPAGIDGAAAIDFYYKQFAKLGKSKLKTDDINEFNNDMETYFAKLVNEGTKKPKKTAENGDDEANMAFQIQFNDVLADNNWGVAFELVNPDLAFEYFAWGAGGDIPEEVLIKEEELQTIADEKEKMKKGKAEKNIERRAFKKKASKEAKENRITIAKEHEAAVKKLEKRRAV